MINLIKDIPIVGDIDYGALEQILRCAETADRAAMMADHHLGYSVPIGGVVAYKNALTPSGVGYDIGCGNKAVLTDIIESDIYDDMDSIMDRVWDTFSFGIGQKNGIKVDSPVFDSDAWDNPAPRGLKQLAASQLGTIGSGNHYIDIFADERSRIWVGVHFGSRGLGHKLATHFMKLGGATDAINAPPLVIREGTPMFDDYLQCMELAGEYAYAGRDWVCEKMLEILGANHIWSVHNHHNFAWKEKHDGEDYWVVRKGSTPAFPRQTSFVGGSMGDNAVIVEGVDSDVSKQLMYSTVHGAGRVMSRGQAKKTIDRESDMMHWVKSRGVVLRGAGTDEAPQAYKRLDDVLNHHLGTIKILHTLRPLGVAMAGSREKDPYKD